MARAYTVTVGGVDYSGVTASAKNQFEALHIAMRTMLVAQWKKDPSDMGYVGAFAGMDFKDVQELARLLDIGEVKRDSDEVPVGLNLFGDNIQDYYLLIGKVARENLGAFWNLRRPDDKAKPEATE